MTLSVLQDPAISVETLMRQGLRRLAKAVVVITAKHAGERYAMAATAVSELSMDPPSLLICVNQTASIFPALQAEPHFCINILHAGQQRLAEACSGAIKGEARFKLGEWRMTAEGPPRLLGAQASFICRKTSCIRHGTHGVFIGDVVSVFVEGAVAPLIYVDGGYTALAVHGREA